MLRENDVHHEIVLLSPSLLRVDEIERLVVRHSKAVIAKQQNERVIELKNMCEFRV